MLESDSPKQVVEALMQGISNGEWQNLHRLYAADAIVEYPFALPSPARLEGLEAIRKYFSTVARLPLKLQTRDMIVHQTADPDVVVAEWDYDGQVTTTGRNFRVSNIQVSRVCNGKIVASRDYHNHVVLAEVMGQLSSIISALAESAKVI